MAEGSRGRRGPSADGFIDSVFSWTLEDIYDENLYRNQVDQIPERFGSVEQYLGSFVYPLLEETRAELHSVMDTISALPYAEVTELEESKPRGTDLYDIKVDRWRNQFSEPGKDPYRTLPGDLLILADAKPEEVSDLQRIGRFWTFALVTKISDNDDENDMLSNSKADGESTSVSFKVTTMKDMAEVTSMQKQFFAIFLVSLTTYRRIWTALHMKRNWGIMQEVLCTDSLGEDGCDLCLMEGSRNVIAGSLTDELNNSQREAILSCLNKIQCPHKPVVELIWGPPGTGKTLLTSMMLVSLLNMKCRTLFCAPTNIAVKGVASRVQKLIGDSPSLNYGDILLFGTKERLKVDSDLEEIYLDYRVDRLRECFARLTGWRHCITSMVDFLERSVHHYHIFVENELLKNKNCEERTGHRAGEKKPFIEFIRERFSSTLDPLARCISILCTHISRSCIPEDDFDNMMSVLGHLDLFRALLFRKDWKLSSPRLEEAFSCKATDMFSSKTLRDQYLNLYMKRCECLSALVIVRDSLNRLDLPSSTSKELIKEFCFGSASLIFCTASNTFKHYLDMEPVKVLVIDEAAQLKECESVIPLQLIGLSHTILVGDECQLPSVVTSKISKEASFGRSLFERLSSLGKSKHLLNIQYRMHPSISHFPNLKFYDGHIQDAPVVKSHKYIRRYLPWPMFGPYSFINISDGREERDDKGPSMRNLVEVAVVLKIVKRLHQAWSSSSKEMLSVGIISPYAAQVKTIRERLGNRYEGSEDAEGFVVNVKTVDGFQGGEDDITIISTVRSNPHGNIGFLANPNRTNVALTRARYGLWILGNERTLRMSSSRAQHSVWEALIYDAIERQCLFNACDDVSLAKTILEVKNMYSQLEDLLEGKSGLFRSARWKVIFSENFRQSFRKLTSRQMKLPVINLLLKLSGGWRPKWKNVDIICENSFQIVKHFKVENLYVLCTVDIEKECDCIQVLKVWDVLPLEDIPKMVKRLDGIYQVYSDEYISRCKENSFEGNLEIPKSWRVPFDFHRCESASENQEEHDSEVVFSSRSYAENSKVSDSLLLMKFYPLSSDIVSHLLSDKDGKEVELPFEVTKEESEIVKFSRSTFILGRSGTGKTTVLTMKLFEKERHYQMASNGDINRVNEEEMDEELNMDVLRQLFVTVSPKLCHAVRRHISQLKSFASGRNFLPESSSADIDFIDSTDQFGDIPDSFIDIPDKLYPLIITFHKFVMMLDGSTGISFFERFADLKKTCNGEVGSVRYLALENFIREREVKFEKFCTCYWPHFNEMLTRRLDPSRVFTEIISHIKGGIQVASSSNGRMSRNEYVSLSEGRASTLTGGERENVYDIFQDYEKMKAVNGEFDLSDLVNDLHRRLQHGKLRHDPVDFVYIDEVQDLTMRQIALFKYISRNVEDGFVFSGDTAQTIARGIDFRFEDVRFLFYKEFMPEFREEHEQNSNRGRISKIFQLSQNFRTHAGILKLAQSVIDLVCRFFPLLIDFLRPETSHICGEAPIFLESGDDENAIISIFGNSSSMRGNVVGFGAEQVILVRDNCAREEVRNYVGKQALVLTIVECKGLEFQDVLLYNFFGSSPMRNQWRVVYEYMKEQDLLDDSSPRGFPHFDPAKHNLLCSELKQLYVAITRTRQRLWICENFTEFSKPMFDYWRKLCLIQVRKLDGYLAEAMKVASTAEQWKSQGWKLLLEKNYEMATLCFERAGFTHGEKLAKAAGLNSAADQLSVSSPEEASHFRRQAGEIYESIGRNELAADCFLALKDYERAGTLFESIGKAKSAAECFFQLKDYERAGRIYLEKCGESALERAGECFSLAGCYSEAAEVYSKGCFFSQCLSVCGRGGLFELGLQYIQSWKGKKSQEQRAEDMARIEQDFLETCARHFYEQKAFKMMMKFVKCFPSVAEIRSFLRSLDCFDELLTMEEELGNYWEAAKVAKLKGDVLLEARLLGQGGDFWGASASIFWYVLFSSLWVTPGSGGWPLKKFEGKEGLLKKAKFYASFVPEPVWAYAQTMSAILQDKTDSLPELRNLLNSSRRNGCITGEILCTRKILDVHLGSDVSAFCCEDHMVLDVKDFSEMQISGNRVSVEAMFYFWSLYKEKIVRIIEGVSSLEKQEPSEDRSYADFCLNYLGVLRLYSSKAEPIFLLLNPEADWARNIGGRSVQMKKKMVSVEVQHFIQAAKKYWGSELVLVSMGVLQCLDALLKSRPPPKVSGNDFSRGRILTQIHEIADFLLGSDALTCSQSDKQILSNFIRGSTSSYLSCVFPLDWRSSLRVNMVSLRGTKASSHLLRQAFELVDPKKKLSYGQIGHLIMIILGSGKLDNGLYRKVSKYFEKSTPWKILIDCIHQEGGLGSSTNMFPEVSAVRKFNGALAETFSANWRREVNYISPPCFVYMLDRLLTLSSCFSRHFFATKSGVVEWLMFHEEDVKACPHLVNPREECHQILEFIAHAIQYLLHNRPDTVQWLAQSGITQWEQYYGLLVLKLFIMLSLLHVNFENFDLLRLLPMRSITSDLPREFFSPLWRAYKRGNAPGPPISHAIAESFKKVNDPLVVVSWGGNFSSSVPPDALYLEITSFKKKEDMLKYLFPEMVKAPTFQRDAVQEVVESSSSPVLPLSSNDLGESSEVSVSEFKAAVASIIEEEPSENIKIMIELWRVLDMLIPGAEVEDWEAVLLSSASALKGDLDRCLSALYLALNEHVWEGKANLLEEEGAPDTLRENLSGMLDDLRQLSTALCLSERKAEDSIPAISEISRRLQSRRPMLEPFLYQMFRERSDDVEGLPEESCAPAASDAGSKPRTENKSQGNKKSKKAKKKKNRGGRK